MLKAYPAAAAAAAIALAGLIGLIVWLIVRHRPTPEETEKRRRLTVNQTGRTIEGEIAEADPHRVHFIYKVRGVEYSATQDIDSLLEFLPCEPSRVIGEVSVKYLQANAANSIVVCEEWSGLPARHYSPLVETAGPAGDSEVQIEKAEAPGGADADLPISVGGAAACAPPCSMKEL